MFKRLFLIGLLCWPHFVYANAGIPMIVIVWPIFWLMLIPIILIEFIVIKKAFPFTNAFTKKMLFWKISVANFVSTLVGIPVAWLVMLFIEVMITGGSGVNFPPPWKYILGVSVQAAWLFPYERQLYWMIPSSFLVLLIPFFILSYWIEYIMLYRHLKKNNISKQIIKNAVWKANICSYLFLAFLALAWLVWNFV